MAPSTSTVTTSRAPRARPRPSSCGSSMSTERACSRGAGPQHRRGEGVRSRAVPSVHRRAAPAPDGGAGVPVRLVLRVRPGVFVPRPETEVLVDVALETIAGLARPTVVPISAPVRVRSRCRVRRRATRRPACGRRISLREAVALARENAERLGLEVVVLQGDLFEPVPHGAEGHARPRDGEPAVPGPRGRRPRCRPTCARTRRSRSSGASRCTSGSSPRRSRGCGRAGRSWSRSRRRDGAAIAAVARRAGFEEVRVAVDLTGRDRVVVARRP